MRAVVLTFLGDPERRTEDDENAEHGRHIVHVAGGDGQEAPGKQKKTEVTATKRTDTQLTT